MDKTNCENCKKCNDAARNGYLRQSKYLRIQGCFPKNLVFGKYQHFQK
jgi:hypothetical protein